MACTFPNERITTRVVEAEIPRGWRAVACPLCGGHAAWCASATPGADGYICAACQRFLIPGPIFTNLQRLSEIDPPRAARLKADMSRRAAASSVPMGFSSDTIGT